MDKWMKEWKKFMKENILYTIKQATAVVLT